MGKFRFKGLLPNPNQLQNSRLFRIFGNFIGEPRLWHFNRSSVASAVSIGLFVAYIPCVGHMLMAGLLAIWFRANLPLSVALVWLVNPLTAIPLLGFGYFIGAKILSQSVCDLNFHSFSVLNEVWQPLLLGCTLCGIALAILGNLFVRLYWRFHLGKKWKLRNERKSRRLELSI